MKYDNAVNHHNRPKSNDHALVNHDYKSQTKKGKSDELHTVIRASCQSTCIQVHRQLTVNLYRLTVSCRSTCMPFNLYAGQPVPSYLLMSSVYYDKICLKFASHRFLLYAVSICQKSLNFTYTHSKCYQQNCCWLHFTWTTLYTGHQSSTPTVAFDAKGMTSY